jgi:VWFA-related protein
VSIVRVSLGVLVAALCLFTLRVTGLAQTSAPQSAQPTFRSTLDLLTLDTSVRDKSGQPVTDLQASDFTVTVDGRPRKVVSAVFFKADVAAGNRLTGGAAPTPQYVSNNRAQPGRVVVFAVDSETIRGGQERPLFETVSKMLEALSPADAVGLVEWPGRAIEVTRDPATVAEVLNRFRGRAANEAEALKPGSNPLPPVPGVSPMPMPMREIEERAHAQKVLLDLAKLLRGMTAIRAPRSIILISGGLRLDRELTAQYKELQRAAAESRVVLYSVLLEEVGYNDVQRRESPLDIRRPPGLVEMENGKGEGLATIGSMTGGMFFNAAGRASGIFDRIQSEVSSFYQLAIESSPADADGKEHDVKVRVSRSGVDVRAPAHVAVAKPSSNPAPRDPLLVALGQPTDVPDVPLAVTAYSTHAASGAINLVVSAEIGAPGGAAPAEWGIAIARPGRDALVRRSRVAAGTKGPHRITTTVEVPPGEYRLRAAALDADGRVGVLEIAVSARHATAAGTRVSDLIVGAVTDGKLEPRRRIAQSEELTALLEVTGAPDVGLAGTLHLIPGGTARAIFRAPFSVRPPSSAGAPAILEARAALDPVPPGRYTASAVLEIAGLPLTRISRIIEVTASAPAAPRDDVAAAPDVPAVAPARAPDEIMRRVGAYVEQYGGQASLLIAVEHYSQSVTGAPAVIGTGRGATFSNTPGAARRLVSEFALVPTAGASGGWLGFRDVIEVNGTPVPDRGDRLQALFQSGAPDLEQARRIADEGARYNIGPVSRNFNVPTTPLFFFHSDNLRRFTFRRAGGERIDGVDTVEIAFIEQPAATLITTAAGKDVPSAGTLWVNPVDGAIVRTRLELRGFDDAGSRAVIDVTYRKDPALAMWVPSRMTERYSGGSEGTATTSATYQDFKRFQTSVKIK